ncbi:PKD domain-containing protein [Flammeovirga sp. SJP92]|uniref:PKD domain-containing protein n=1 Tax=Flammeovirga sp. SJP92 TaxID=1775430 RepID=UPI000788EA38|nr:PKD domain-containing protein [Flammeovirga sp. SJP92]
MLIGYFAHLHVMAQYNGEMGPAMTTQTWPAGTFLAHFPEGDRINTYHRNYLMIAGQAGTGIWDVSSPATPKRIQFDERANNGHRWWKINDLYWREYSVPQTDGTGYKYLDMSNMLDLKPVTTSDVLYTVESGNPHYDKLETFPHTIDGNRIYDMRSGEFLGTMPEAISKPDIVMRIGNYVFYVPQTGAMSVFDFGDPENVKFLGSFGGDIPHEQYSTGIQVWRNNIIYMSGNEAVNSMVGFDISDPTNVKHAFDLSSDEITLGRYMMFQDEYGFSGRFDRGVKFNFETMKVELEFTPASDDEVLQFIDNQWMPLGHILVASGDGKTTIFCHQDGLDTKPPTVGFQFPEAGATNLPVTSTLGFVINETLQDITLTDQTIQVSPLGGTPIVGDVTSTSYNVVNYAPREALLPNTTYEVKFVEGGIKDAVGNGMEEYIFYFTTGGDASNKSPEITAIDIDITSPFLAGNKVNFTASASDYENQTMSYRWDFGDGSPQTAWGSELVSHTYTSPGNYTVQVQVSDNNGGFSVKSLNVNVIGDIPTELPMQSSPILVDELKRNVWVVNPDNNSVSILDADLMTFEKEIPVSFDPVSIAMDGNRKIWVTCRDNDKVYVIDADTEVIDEVVTLPRGTFPFGIVFNADGSRGFVAGYGSGKVIEMSTADYSIKQSIEVGPTPRAMAIAPNTNTLYVTQFISPQEQGNVWEIDLTTFSLKEISLPIDDFSIDNGNQGRGIPNYISGISIHPNGGKAWTVGKKDNVLRGGMRDGKPLTFDNSVRTAISHLDLGLSSEIVPDRLDIDNHGQPSSVAYTPNGNYVLVTMQGNNHVVVIDPEKGLELLQKDVGLAPQGMVFDKVTNKLFVKNFMDRTVSVFDADALVKNGNLQLEELATVSTVTSELLTAQVLKGKQIFYDASNSKMGSDGYISCASCHNDGAEDGRVWDFSDRGEGFRNTITLKGRAGTAHGPVHWSANFDEIHDFENDIRNNFNGQGFMTDADFHAKTNALTLGTPKAGLSEDLDALVAYIESLDSFASSPYKEEDGTLTADGLAGQQIFQQLKCASCHGGEHFTDSNLGIRHDVGTQNANSGNRLGKDLLGIDTPTLRGVWNTAPYLHDGSALTLEAIFKSKNPMDGHGATSSLSTQEFDQLISYLKQIDGLETTTELPEVSQIISPADGQVIDKNREMALEISSALPDITKVEYYVDGELVSTVETAPFIGAWTPVVWKNYKLNARIFYNNGNTSSLTPEITTTYKGVMDVMFIVGDKNLSPDDLLIKNRIQQQFGFNVYIFDDDDVSGPTMTNAYDLILVSSTVEPSIIGQNIERTIIPVMTWDPFMYSKLSLADGDLDLGYGFTTNGHAKASVTNPLHPIVSGISTSDSVDLYSVVQFLPYSNVSTEATVMLEAEGKPILFGYDQGSGVASSRRLAFPLRDQFMHLFSDDGWKMFDAAVIWTLHGGNADTPVQQLPDVYFTSPTANELVNAPLKIFFETENWSLPSTEYKLRFKIDGSDRGLITEDSVFQDNTALSEGPHLLTFLMERSDNSATDITDSIWVNVTNDPLPAGPTAIFNSPSNGGYVGPDFDIRFSLYKFDIAPGGPHVDLYIDDVYHSSHYTLASIPITGLEGGDHTLKLILVNTDGTTHGLEASITITVDPLFANMPQTPFSIQYRDNSAGVLTQELKPVLRIHNDSADAVLLDDFTIRYWFTNEEVAPMSFGTDYSSVKGVDGTFATYQGEQFVELAFASSGMLNGKSNTGEIQLRMHQSSYQMNDQSNDFSFNAAQSSFGPNVKITLYRKGELVWGIEPVNVNQPPKVIVTTSAIEGKSPLIVDFDASASTDPEGTVLTYLWEFGGGSTSVESLATHTFTAVGQHSVTLKVTDADGMSSKKVIDINVLPDQVPPMAKIIVDESSGEAPLVVAFDGTSSSDMDGTIVSYLWEIDGTTAATALTNYTFNQVGDQKVYLTVTDDSGLTSTDSIIISVKGANQLPLASFISSATTGFAPLTVDFDASTSSDPDNDPLTYTWNFGGGSPGTGVTTSATFGVGTHEVILTVEDGRGGIASISQTITVEVNPNAPSCAFGTPSVTAIPDLSNVTYEHIYVLGNDTWNLDQVKDATLNWSLANNGLWQFSLNTNNGVPSWWVDLTASITHTLADAQPTLTFTASGIPEMDGTYYATMEGSDFVLVEITGKQTLYFTNSTTAPSCENTSSARQRDTFNLEEELNTKVFPNPFTSTVYIQPIEGLQEIWVYDLVGVLKKHILLNSDQKDLIELDNTWANGLYILRMKVNDQYIDKKIIKHQ